MIEWHIILAILVAHFMGDFVLQSDKIALHKSKDNKILLKHVLIYTSVLTVLTFNILIIHNDLLYLYFILINGVAHFITDYVTSRLAAQAFQEQKRHQFFTLIGLDQLIHYTTLFGTYILLC